MPSTIPYDPSLVLANVVNTKAIKIVEDIAKAQAPSDAAHDDLNALLSSRRSLDMTKTELANLGVSTAELDKSIEDTNAEIAKSAADYATKKAKAEAEVKVLRSQIKAVSAGVESPVDFVKTGIKTLPLAADSINMDVQYFSRDSNKQDSNSFASTIAGFVSVSTKILGNTKSAQISSAAQAQVSQQVEQHDIEGTLVISVACTHKNASILAPFILHVDKAIKVWNRLFKDDKLNPTNRSEMLRLAMADDPEGGNKFSILSGTTYGSSFVGMVHILNTSSTNAHESLANFASSVQAQKTMDFGGWLAKASGSFGVDESITNDVKNLLSTQNVTSHVTMVCMGVIPSIAANDVELGVKQFAQFDPKASMEAIAEIQNATADTQSSVQAAANASRTGQNMMSLQASKIKAGLSELSEIKKRNNKILDTNSMMTALSDYLAKASNGGSGVPINYYLKDITKDMLAEMWVAKYYPGEFMAIKYDDSEGAGPAASAGGSGAAAS